MRVLVVSLTLAASAFGQHGMGFRGGGGPGRGGYGGGFGGRGGFHYGRPPGGGGGFYHGGPTWGGFHHGFTGRGFRFHGGFGFRRSYYPYHRFRSAYWPYYPLYAPIYASYAPYYGFGDPYYPVGYGYGYGSGAGPNITVISVPPVEPQPPIVIYTTPPRTEARKSGAVSSRQQSERAATYLIALRDGAIRTVVGYWVNGNTVHIIRRGNEHEAISLEQVDLPRTEELNRARGVEFRLR